MTPGRRTALLVGGLLLVPRIGLAWIASADPVAQLVATLLLVAGLFVLGGALIRIWLSRHERVLPVALVGVGLVLVAGLALRVRPPGEGDPIRYSGGLLAPPAAALEQWLYLLVAAASQLGLVLLVGSVGVALARWAGRRAAR